MRQKHSWKAFAALVCGTRVTNSFPPGYRWAGSGAIRRPLLQKARCQVPCIAECDHQEVTTPYPETPQFNK